MKRFNYPYEKGCNTGNGFYAVARTIDGKFCVVQWNAHHKNWTRQNKNYGSATHRLLGVLIEDGLCGGPIFHTLKQAREIAGVEI